MKNIGRNDPCSCGSGKKYKKCCIDKNTEYDDRVKSETPVTENTQFEVPELFKLIDSGTGEYEINSFHNACNHWEKAWQKVKETRTPGIKDIAEIGQLYNKPGKVFNWCQDYEIALTNAGLFDRRISYCSEFVGLFPDSDPQIIENMGRALADSYFYVGEPQKGEEELKRLSTMFPKAPWVLIGWGDVYSPRFNYKHVAPDINKAEMLYRKALEVADENDRDDVLERIEGLKEYKNNSKNHSKL